MYYSPDSVTGITAPGANQACYSKFIFDERMDTMTNHWEMGIPFYQTFEITHDMDNNKVKFKNLGYGVATDSSVAA